MLGTDFGTALLEREHDHVTVRSHRQGQERIAKHLTDPQHVRGLAVRIAADIQHEYACRREASASVLIELERIELRRDAGAGTCIREDDVLAR